MCKQRLVPFCFLCLVSSLTAAHGLPGSILSNIVLGRFLYLDILFLDLKNNSPLELSKERGESDARITKTQY